MAITFERPLSTYITNYLANNHTYNMQLACEIVLQDLVSTLRYATADISVTSLSQGTSSVAVSPINFVHKISGAPEVRHSQGKAVDASELKIINLDYIITQALPTAGRPFDNSTITIYLCFPKPDGNYEGLIYFIGKIIDVGGDDEDAAFASQSDVGYQFATMGKEVTQRCVNELGDPWCAVNNLPVGAVCSKLQDDKVGGCLYWGGVFNGVGFIDPTGAIQGYSGPIPDPTWGAPNPDPWSRFKQMPEVPYNY